MKKIIFFAAMLMSVLAFKNANAQLNISLNLNIGVQPTWGPVGYDHVEYYYLPDIDCYYYVPGRQFIYFNGIRWVKSLTLPPRYSTYDLYSGYKVVINEETPYLRNNIYRARYAPFRNRGGSLSFAIAMIINTGHNRAVRATPGRGHNPVTVRAILAQGRNRVIARVILSQDRNQATVRTILARGHSPETVTTVPVTPAKSLARGRNRVREIIARVAIASRKGYKSRMKMRLCFYRCFFSDRSIKINKEPINKNTTKSPTEFIVICT
ncbi:MAG: hypothetical protein JWQ79_3476 [Mucilaginibacter sp.]|nr:hypothetical protein [Mucilaginibacter sp.]